MKLVVESLGCIRGGRRLFQELSFGLEPGGAILVSGPNGAGKTSLLRLVAGLLTPSEGRISLEGSEHSVGEASHFVGHLDTVKGALTAEENLAFGRDLLGGTDLEIGAALERVGIGALKDLPAQVLSAGQKRRLALARLVAAPRPIWLLDEPTAALDSAGHEMLVHLVEEHRGKGGILLAATHAALHLKNVREIALPRGGS